jgi:hypothetical protein
VRISPLFMRKKPCLPLGVVRASMLSCPHGY